MTLIPTIKQNTTLPLIAAGGIATGNGMVAAMALGAEGIQIGSRFASATESSAHELFKQLVIDSKEGDTLLSLKKLAPVRLIKNKFFEIIHEAENNGAGIIELRDLLGKGRAKKGIFEGALDEGELEIGQIASVINKIEPVKEIFKDILSEYQHTLNQFKQEEYQTI